MSHVHKAAVDPNDVQLSANHRWRLLPIIAGAIGVGGLAVSYLLSSRYSHPQFYFSYLTAFLYWLSIALGGLFFVIVQFASKAGWSVTVRRLAENAMVTLPLFALLFLPIAVGGMHELYHWTHHDAVANDPLLQQKAAYLNLPFFYLRALIYFLVWGVLGVFFYRRSVAQDQGNRPEITASLQRASAPAIVLFALTISFAAIDWIMSLDPHWYSTMYGVYYFAGSVVAIFAFLPVIAIAMRAAGLLTDLITLEHYHDLGKLLFGFTVFWTYIAFSQFMLQWYANIPEETMWYAHRGHGSWKSLSILLGVGHFAVPFFFLMTRWTKRRTATLLVAAVWLLVMHYADIYWLVMPTLHREAVELGLLDLTTFLGVGGLFLAIFALQLRRHALIPIQDPRLGDALSFENY